MAARFSNKIIVTLVTQGLPSPFLSRPVGGGKGGGGGGEIACDGGVRANREGGFSLPSLYPLFASLFPLYPRNFYKTTSQSLCDCSATFSVAQLKHDTM